MKKVKLNNFKNIFSFLILILFLFSVLVLTYNKKGVFALENPYTKTPIVCEEGKKIETPYITQRKELVENILEIPLGKSTDQIEFVAKEILEKVALLEKAVLKETEATEQMIELIEELKAKNCEPVCKKEEGTEKKCCGVEPVADCGKHCDSGPCPFLSPCPALTGRICKRCEVADFKCEAKRCKEGDNWSLPDIIAAQNEIEIQAEIIDINFKAIADFFESRFWPITLYIEQYGMETIDELAIFVSIPSWLTNILPRVSGNLDEMSKELCEILYEENSKIHANLCISPVERHVNGHSEIEGFLDKSREKSAKCVIRPHEIEALMRGEIAGKFFLSCQTILSGKILVHSYLDKELQEGCYGSIYCEAKVMEKEAIPYPPPPCAEDYYCCGMIKVE